MRVGLNATCFNDRPSGAKQRFEGIYGALIQKLPDVEFLVYEPADCRVADWFSGAANVTPQRTPLPSEGRVRSVLGTVYWPAKLKRSGVDILECFNQPLVVPPSRRAITTIHDIRRVYPDWGVAERTAYRWSLRRTCDEAGRIITVSEAMRSEILGFEPNARVSVVYNGLDPKLFAAVTDADMDSVRRKFRLPSEFILAVGHFEARKNYPRLIDAIAALRDRGRDLSLVIVGNDSGERRLVEQRVSSLGLASRVKILSGLSDVEVRCMYKLSGLFVFPSLYEGFGIPILEAMAAGVPYVLSDLGVFREITQNRCVYFTPTDVESIAEAIDQVASSESTQKALIGYGSVRVRDFSFDVLADQVAAVYMAVMNIASTIPRLARGAH